EERYLTELEFDQAVTKPPETYPKKKVDSSIYDLDYEKQYATFTAQQLNEYIPTEKAAKYDSDELPTEKLRSSTCRLDYEKQYAELSSKQYNEFETFEQTLDYESTKLSIKKVEYESPTHFHSCFLQK
ncbi:unnamed protein product, partial [Rotaria socialis]